MKLKNWEVLDDFFEIEEQQKLKNFLINEYAKNIVYPPKKDIFRAFKLTPYEKVNVVILGQDPYHSKGVADGLAFSTSQSKAPPSLINIDKLIFRTYNKHIRSYDLSYLAEQGVLLLNTALSVISGIPNSHGTKIWDVFCKAVLAALNEKEKLVYLLWGNYAKSYEKYINKNHIKIKAAHPSPLAGNLFLESNCFFEANKALEKLNLSQILWY